MTEIPDVKKLPLNANGHIFGETEVMVIGDRPLDMYRHCAICDGWPELKVSGDHIDILTKCPYPNGLVTEITLDVPSGRIIVTDDLRPIYDGFDRVGFADYNTALGQAQVVQAFAQQGCAFGGVLNTCPSLYQVGIGKYVIASPALDEEEEEILAEGWQHLAGIITDLWAYSIADYADWQSKGGDPAKLGWSDTVVEIPAGTYKFTYHGGERGFDFDSAATVIFADIEKIA